MDVSKSSYLAWSTREPSQRAISNAKLDALLQQVYVESRGRYGYRRMFHAVRNGGFSTSKNRVVRRMKHLNLRATKRRKWKTTTDSEHGRDVAPNVLDREFNPSEKDVAWVTDVTFVHTNEGWLHLCVMLDLWSRKVIGWATSERNDTTLALATLTTAVGVRNPASGWIHHSDRGSAYASFRYEAALKKAGAIASMSHRGDCFDNAVAESFFGSMKTEMNYKTQRYLTQKEAHDDIVNYIVWYNSKRIHSSLGYVSPNDFEVANLMKQTT